MSSPKKNRTAFRPSLSTAALEDRMVLATLGTTVGGIPFAFIPPSNVAQPPPADPPFTPGASVGALGTLRGPAANRAVQAAYTRQFRAASADLQQTVNGLATMLYLNGQPTQQQIANFNSAVAGAVNATALRLSSQASLLPGSSGRLVPALQSALLGSGANSLVSRLQNASLSDNSLTASGLQSALTRQINSAFRGNMGQLNSFFNTTPLSRLSVNSTGQAIPLGQFIGNQLVNQFGNTFGSLSQATNSLANSSLFANGVTNPTAAAQSAFTNQVMQGLNTAAFQLGSGLSLFNTASNGLFPRLQGSLFGNNPSSFMNTFQGLTLNNTGFGTASSNAFNTGFQNLGGSLNNFFGLNSSQANLNLPTTPSNGVFGSQFSNFGNGFNNGFGTGFVGLGTPSSNFNSSFGTGFNSAIGAGNRNFGFSTAAIQPGVPTAGNGFGFTFF